jgi:hypothetical protein
MRTLAKTIARWELKEEELKQALIDGALDMRRDLQKDNPLKRGRSSASWNVSTPAMSRHKQKVTYYNPTESRFLDARTNVGRFKLGWTLHISNLQHYIQELEWSHREKAGWVRRTQDLHTDLILRKLSRVMMK